ncbi:hypothetical protein AAA799O18_00570 [Marine Group I thaumarchaeote SCGC AAA799-O18]|nr:hypothetical protein AAA799O18_00570 [Marine Group I thaumarchaeote SCGC AAA799-O18]
MAQEFKIVVDGIDTPIIKKNRIIEAKLYLEKNLVINLKFLHYIKYYLSLNHILEL